MYLANLLFVAIVYSVAYDYSAAVFVSSDTTPYFRKDYVFNADTQNFYKVNKIKRNWMDALNRCKLEGATLFIPDTQLERDIVKDLVIKQFPSEPMPGTWWWILIGAHDLFSKGDYVTVDGRAIDDIYIDWFDNQPDNFNHEEDCLAMERTGKMHDINCTGPAGAFVCEKSRAGIEWNHFCELPDMNYLYNKDLGRCYKFHSTKLNWQDAYAACTAEESYLAIINSQAEADYLVQLLKDMKAEKFTGLVSLGFHNHLNIGWTTIKGQPLNEVGYTTWGQGQPDNSGANERCGSMFLDGKLNDVTCSYSNGFICERDIPILSSIFEERFNSINSTTPPE